MIYINSEMDYNYLKSDIGNIEIAIDAIKSA